MHGSEECCNQCAPYQVRKTLWLCETHYNEWLEHDYNQSPFNPTNEGVDYRTNAQ
jgi:hypothetical protein